MADVHNKQIRSYNMSRIKGKYFCLGIPKLIKYHSWHTTLYITPDGFSTQSIPYAGRAFQIDFDFRKHKLYIRCSNTEFSEMKLYARTVADFYAELFDKLSAIGVNVKIHPKPNEIEPAIPFAENTVNKAYNPDVANKLWRAMLKTNEVFNQFRSGFIGKASPVHLFWGPLIWQLPGFRGIQPLFIRVGCQICPWK